MGSLRGSLILLLPSLLTNRNYKRLVALVSMAGATSRLSDPTTEKNEESLLLLKNSDEGNVQKDDPRESKVKPRLLTVSYSCIIIIQTWLVFGLTIGYTSPVLSDLEGDGNSSAPLDKITYQDLFSVC